MRPDTRFLWYDQCGTTCRTLVDVFAATAAEFADAAALTADGRTYSYAQLDAWSDALSELLRSYGVGRGDRVALRLAASAEAVVAMLGILKAGAAYVPLDVRNPPSRNASILDSGRVAALIGGLDEDPVLDPFRGLTLIDEATVAALRDAPAVTPRPGSGPEPAGPGPDDMAYAIYTSGTTGTPKGVPISHGSVVTLLAGMADQFSFCSTDHWLLFHSISFDFSVWEIWGAFASGARLVVLPRHLLGSPSQWARFAAEQGVTVLNQTPTAFGALAAASQQDGIELPDLRYIFFGGEKLAPAAVRPWADRVGLKQPTLVNMYGITETTVFTTYHEVTEDDLTGDTLPIGHLLPGFLARVVTDDGADAPVGELGELWLAGPQVADGYQNRPDLTRERFPIAPAPDGGPDVRYYRSGDLVAWRPGGDLDYHGRADLQVKLRGHRIELSDIEIAVRSHPAVADAVVWVHEFKPGDQRIVCAFVTPDAAVAPDARHLRAHVKRLLPSYMQPTSYHPLGVPYLPQTVNGKVNRAEVARIWKEERDAR